MKIFVNKMFEAFLKFSSSKPITALKDGFVLTMPFTLIGSIFMLIANLPFNNYTNTMAKIFGVNWNVGLNQVSACTYDILAIIIAIGIGYSYAKNEKQDGISCAMLSFVSFLIVSASSVTAKSGEVISGVIPRGWTGGSGVITAIIVGLLVGIVFCFFMKRNIRIKMPEGVPEGVSNAFSALIPGFVVILVSTVIYQICISMLNLSFTEVIFKGVQIPLQNLSDTLFGGIVIVLLMSILFWAGLHGPNIVMGIMAPLLTANALSNQAILNSGVTLTVSHGARIMTPQIIDCFVKFGGTGITIGLLIASLMGAKSKQMKEISKLSILPGMFGINEPVIYGLPIVYNPVMLIPFIAVPLISLLITYGATVIGFLTPFSGVQVPWTTPPIVSGFILAGFKGSLIQVIIIILSITIYFPFMKVQDAQCLKAELQTKNKK